MLATTPHRTGISARNEMIKFALAKYISINLLVWRVCDKRGFIRKNMWIELNTSETTLLEDIWILGH